MLAALFFFRVVLPIISPLHFQLNFFLIKKKKIWLHREARGILIPQLGIEPMLPAVEARSL